MTETFQILSPRDHARQRTGMYMGSVSLEKIERFVLGKWKIVDYVPALNKMIDEIIDNSIDEAIRTNFVYANKIDITIDGNKITVADNGRGIPQDEIIDTATGERVLRPVAAWTRTNAGTSFTEDRTTIGANGLGSAITNYLSMVFCGETWRDGKLVIVDCKNGADIVIPQIKKKNGNGTKVSFIPDFSLLGIQNLNEANTIELVEDRITSLQLAFPEIQFSFNGKKVEENNIKKYSNLFTNDAPVIFQNDNISMFFVMSEDGFRSNSYVNGVNTRLGGSYVDYIVNGVVEELSILIKKKHKIEVTKSVIKNGLTFVLFVRNFTDPKFDSQTKERLTNSLSNVKEHYSNNNGIDFVSLAKKIMGSSYIIDPIIEAQLAKKLAAEKRAATLEQKKLKKVKVAKHIAANDPSATLFLCEGDSALGGFLKVRDPKKSGGYPLRGVIMNTWDMKPSEVLKNKELSELIAVLGLDINDQNSIDDMNYANIATLTDADHDGEKIAVLLIGFFYKFWPRLILEGKVHITRSPILISTKGKETKWFYGYDEANEFKQSGKSKGFVHRYIKGLASLQENEYYQIINNPVFDTVKMDNKDLMEMMLGLDSKPRKEFIMA
jgi:DNA gyrase/topoisomerase IV subunit B